MQQPPVRTPPSLGGLESTGNSPHAQFLATEHWSLLATRSMTWNEIFSRTGTYLTVLSAIVIALSLVANATGFGQGFRTFALLILPVVLLVGVGTYFRLVEADIEDAWLVIGMNRLRHAYLELAPELEPYFVASHHDDTPGILQTYSFRRQVGLTHWLSGSPVSWASSTRSSPACLQRSPARPWAPESCCEPSPASLPLSRPRSCSAPWAIEKSAR
jgi:hypothetical protein